MTTWTQIVWSEAQQILDRGGVPVRVPSATPPEDYFAQLRAEGRLIDALIYLAHALSRRDAISWALSCLVDFGLAPGDPVACAVTAWLDDGGEAHRRTAENVGARALPGSAEQLLASAILFSGGSVADDGQKPAVPPRESCGRFVACAIVKASTHGRAFERRVLHALDRGEAVARVGSGGIRA